MTHNIKTSKQYYKPLKSDENSLKAYMALNEETRYASEKFTFIVRTTKWLFLYHFRATSSLVSVL